MAVIQTVLESVDTVVANVGASIYSGVAGEVASVVQVASVLVVCLVGINLAIQAIPMTLANGVGLIVRLAGVFMFTSAAASYSNFDAVYGTLTRTPGDFGAVILAEILDGRVTNLYDGLDQLYMNSLRVGDAVAQNGSYISGALAAVIMFLCAALMATISIIILSAAKLMLGVLVLIGPLAVATTLFKQSAPFFEAYVKLALGFALVPMLAAAMAGFTIMVATDVTPTDLSTVESIGDVVSFIVVMLLGSGLLAMVPTTASSLAQTGIGIGAAASSTFQQARTGRALAGKAASGASYAGGAALGLQGKALSTGASGSAQQGHRHINTILALANRQRGK